MSTIAIPDDYDSPWKEAIEHYLPEFMAFFFPEAHAAIDWLKGYRFLDQELKQVVQDAELGRRYVDKLVEIARHGGEQDWVYIHIEVQGNRENDFAERVFTYHYRLFDRYRRPIASLVVLADEQPGWRPSGFGYELFGCRLQLDFPTAKLLDQESELDLLLASDNAFAIVTAAHLLTRRTRHDSQARFEAKWQLCRLLYQRGWERQRILDLFSVIDWMMRLPTELSEKFHCNLANLEEEKKMRYVTSVEQMAMDKGLRQGVQQGIIQGEAKVIRSLLLRRFGSLPQWAEEHLANASPEQLGNWAERLLDAKDLKAVFH